MVWSWKFFAATKCIHACGDIAACKKGIHALTALFQPAGDDASPDIAFVIRKRHADMVLTINGELAWQGRDAGEMVAAFEMNFYNRIIDALPAELISLHAATVAVRGLCLSCAGASGAGKSSLCTRMLLAGGTYFSDEYTLLDKAGRVLPFPRPLQWSEEVHPAFSTQSILDSGLLRRTAYRFPDKDGRMVTSVLWHPAHVARAPVQINIVLLPRYASSSPAAEITPLHRSQALLELTGHLHQIRPAIENVRLLHARIPSSVRFYRLIFSDVHAAWRALMKTIIQT